MQRIEWQAIEQKCREHKPQTIHDELTIYTNLLLCALLEEVAKMNDRIEKEKEPWRTV